ncbi:hypothetical protein BKA56DRAFT_702110 [Ilyonectria sp. MPI-CAGE-AT-0026]|nr:hypothetical protein BKA56DRAFT_702110 [Ilyonectria sp. MPI-CAGE-AT-0026]
MTVINQQQQQLVPAKAPLRWMRASRVSVETSRYPEIGSCITSVSASQGNPVPTTPILIQPGWCDYHALAALHVRQRGLILLLDSDVIAFTVTRCAATPTSFQNYAGLKGTGTDNERRNWRRKGNERNHKGNNRFHYSDQAPLTGSMVVYRDGPAFSQSAPEPHPTPPNSGLECLQCPSPLHSGKSSSPVHTPKLSPRPIGRLVTMSQLGYLKDMLFGMVGVKSYHRTISTRATNAMIASQ